MPRVAKALTITEVQAAKPKDREYNLADGKGLYLRVKTNGTKLWIFNYTHPHTKKRGNISLGSYPVVTLADAREERRNALVLLQQKIDPKERRDDEDRKLRKAYSETLEKVTRQWIELKKTKVSEDHAGDIIRSFEMHLFPDMGKTPVYKITAKQAIEVLQPIADKGTLETVRRLCQRLNEVMTYATNTGLIHHNPLAGIKEAFSNPKVRNMPAIPPNHLPELMQKINGASIKKITRCLMEFQLHTMTRPNEAAGARWDEMDLDNNLWVIPAERMKAGRIHKIPLTPQVLALLETMKAISGNRIHVFPGDRDPNQHISEQTANMALRRMGYQGVQVAHGFRSIASTALNDEGFDGDLIECALSHVEKDEVRAAYNRADYLERRKVMMRWWSDYITKACMGNISLSGGTRGLRAVS
ncbi:integrase domain-containing protein [Endozoicomonas acroporae]|uniref:integrase domain-containing protein n=1 Tax=Endozoicomonas acroporae TaxID=1701104 RepID=UPI0013D3D5ED|nr:integrase domain-containing protein [Endozoicomonas acroporae]